MPTLPSTKVRARIHSSLTTWSKQSTMILKVNCCCWKKRARQPTWHVGQQWKREIDLSSWSKLNRSRLRPKKPTKLWISRRLKSRIRGWNQSRMSSSKQISSGGKFLGLWTISRYGWRLRLSLGSKEAMICKHLSMDHPKREKSKSTLTKRKKRQKWPQKELTLRIETHNETRTKTNLKWRSKKTWPTSKSYSQRKRKRKNWPIKKINSLCSPIGTGLSKFSNSSTSKNRCLNLKGFPKTILNMTTLTLSLFLR